MSLDRDRKIMKEAAIAAMGFALLILALSEPKISDNANDYFYLNVTLLKNPEIRRASRRSDKINFSFNQFPDAVFSADWDGSANTKLKDFIAGDSATIQILKEEFQRVIEKKGTLLERIVTNQLTIYGFMSNGKNYINFQKVKDGYITGIGIYALYGFFILLICRAIIIIYKLKISKNN